MTDDELRDLRQLFRLTPSERLQLMIEMCQSPAIVARLDAGEPRESLWYPEEHELVRKWLRPVR